MPLIKTRTRCNGMTRRNILQRFYRSLMGKDIPQTEQSIPGPAIRPELKDKLASQVKILTKHIRSLEKSVEAATRCGVEVPESVCLALYQARMDRRTRILVLNRINECEHKKNDESKNGVG